MKSRKEKYYLFAMFTFTIILCSTSIVFADKIDYNEICADYTQGIGAAVRILGHLLVIVKIVVPIIIIVLGMVDFGKAALSSDDKAMNKAVGALTRRFIAGAAIFLLPGLISAVLDLIGITGGIEDNTRFGDCTQCILNASEKCPLSSSPVGSSTHQSSSGTTHGGRGGKF